MAYITNAFCWNGLVTKAPAATAAFFPEVFGWRSSMVDMGGDPMTIFAHDGAPIAHLREPGMEGEPSWWNNYLRVDDVDKAAAAAQAHGGTVLVPPTDIVPGRFATVTTPSGAAFTLFREAEASEGSNRSGGVVGNVHWVDLHSKDIAADLAFLQGALGFETAPMEMPNGTYHLLNAGGETRGGAMAGMHEGAPSFWLAWVNVASVDDTLARVTSHGGAVIAPAWDVPGVGRMAIASDPAGVTFGVITPPAAGQAG